MVLISRRKRRTGSLGDFTQYHIGSVMTHLNSIFYPFLFKSLSIFSTSVSSSLFISPSLFFMFHMHYLCVLPTLCDTHISFCSFFIYIMGGLDVCRNDCVQGITRIYTPIWVASDQAKYSPALLGAALFHVFIVHVLQNVLRLCAGLLHVFSSDWTQRHALRRISKQEVKQAK